MCVSIRLGFVYCFHRDLLVLKFVGFQLLALSFVGFHLKTADGIRRKWNNVMKMMNWMSRYDQLLRNTDETKRL